MKCPACDYPLEAHQPVSGKRAPGPGDFSICCGCGDVQRFENSASVRLATPPDYVGLHRHTLSAIFRAQAAVRAMRTKVTP